MQTTLLPTSKQWREAWRANWAHPDLVRVKVAVAYCSRRGVGEIKRVRGTRRVPLQLVVGLNDGVTDALAQEALFHWSQSFREVEVRGQFQTRGRFHPKVYIFELKDQVRVLAGSVNLTHSAFFENTEAALEWVLPTDSLEAQQVLTTFAGWWDMAPALQPPGDISRTVSRLGVEEQLIAMMREGMLVEIEAILAPARGHLKGDAFRLGKGLRVQEGAILVERSQQAQVFLIGAATYNRLTKRRDEAHENCRSLSFPCTAGHFVPATAFAHWKERHNLFEHNFQELLRPFSTVQGRAREKKYLKAELPERIAKAWKSIHGTKPLPAARRDIIIRSALKEFDREAPTFPSSVRLKLSLAPHPFPAMRSYTQSPSIVEAELYAFAQDNREEILRNWMTALLTTTRQRMLPALIQLGDKSKKPEAQTKAREDLCRDLKLLNFYRDTFCGHVAETLMSTERPLYPPEEWKKITCDDLLAVEKWPKLTLEEVLYDFACRVGWL